MSGITKAVTDKDFAKIMDKIEALENTLLILLQHKAKRAQASARRLKNMHDQEVVQFELFDGLAGDLDGIISARKEKTV